MAPATCWRERAPRCLRLSHPHRCDRKSLPDKTLIASFYDLIPGMPKGDGRSDAATSEQALIRGRLDSRPRPPR